MEVRERVIGILESIVWWGPTIGTEKIPLAVIALLGTGLFLTLRLGFIQLRRLGHGFAVTSGKYDDPNEPGDVSHFQALSTALSATVGGAVGAKSRREHDAHTEATAQPSR